MAIALSVVACLVAVVGAPAAHAGYIWVTEGNMNAGQTGGCGAFAPEGDFGSNVWGPIFTAPSACPMSIVGGDFVPPGDHGAWMTTAPPGVTIIGAWTAPGDVSSSSINQNGWVVEDFWRDITSGAWGGSTLANGQQWFNTGLEGDPNINSQIYGFQLACARSVTCAGLGPPEFSVSGVELQGVESTPPYVIGQGSLWLNDWYMWNPPGDPWPLTLYASDVSGICASQVALPNTQMNGPLEPRDDTVWQQCPNPLTWTVDIDTRSEVPTAGYFNVDLSADNAAGVRGNALKAVPVDNDPVNVSFRTPNDPNPTIWVNHAVTIDATPSAGPSGVGGMNCGVDGGEATTYPASGLTVDGDGIHTVTCTAWNTAIGPQGQPNTGTSTINVHIDESPPSLAFEPQDPGNPTELVVDTNDSESGVAGGSIEMAPAGTDNWTALPTTYNGAQLLAHFDDAGLTGSYVFRATACDNVGNCSSTDESLAMPVRLASDSDVSLTQIINPLHRRVVTERVRVGGHLVTVRRGHKLVAVKRGGHFKTIKVVKYVERCRTKRVLTSPHHWQLERVCKIPTVHVTSTMRVPYGHSVTIHGLYMTAGGVPLSGQPVHILAAPNNGSNAFAPLMTVTTAPDGSWTATVPPGPSRIIEAVTDGTATVLPSSGEVTTVVPAKVSLLRVWPRHVAWGGTVHLLGQLFGGYLPPGGALVRLRIGYGSAYTTYGVQEHVTGDGSFSTVASFGPGDPKVFRTYWFQIASLPMGDYPFAPAASQRVPVIVGGHPH